MTTRIISYLVGLSSTVLGGGIILGSNIDRINVLCEGMQDLQNDHDILREKVYDIHTKVCVIDEKLTTLIKNK